MPVDESIRKPLRVDESIRKLLRSRGAMSRSELRQAIYARHRCMSTQLDTHLAPLLESGEVKTDWDYTDRGKARYYWICELDP
jgi:hypothetical protein